MHLLLLTAPQPLFHCWRLLLLAQHRVKSAPDAAKIPSVASSDFLERDDTDPRQFATFADSLRRVESRIFISLRWVLNHNLGSKYVQAHLSATAEGGKCRKTATQNHQVMAPGLNMRQVWNKSYLFKFSNPLFLEATLSGRIFRWQVKISVGLSFRKAILHMLL